MSHWAIFVPHVAPNPHALVGPLIHLVHISEWTFEFDCKAVLRTSP